MSIDETTDLDTEEVVETVDDEPTTEEVEGFEEDDTEPSDADAQESDTEEEPDDPEAEAEDDEESFTTLNPNELPKGLRPFYREMQRDYTQKTQELAALRQQVEPLSDWGGFFEAQGIDPGSEEAPAEVFVALAQAFESQNPGAVNELLGVTGDGGEGDGQDLALSTLAEDDNPVVAALAKRLEQVEQGLTGIKTAEQQQANEQAMTHFLGEQFSQIAEEMGLDKLDPEYAQTLVRMADFDENGLPKIADAHDQLQKVTGVRKQRIKQSKKAPKAPPSGPAGAEDFDPTDEKARKAHMLSLAAEIGPGR